MIAGSRSIRHLFASYFIFHCSAHTATPCYFPLLFYHHHYYYFYSFSSLSSRLNMHSATHCTHTVMTPLCSPPQSAFVHSCFRLIYTPSFFFSLNKKKDDIRSILKFNVETINNYSPQRRKKKTKFLPTCGEEKFGE